MRGLAAAWGVGGSWDGWLGLRLRAALPSNLQD